MNPPTNRVPRIVCGVACALALLMAIGHGYGHLQGWPAAANDDEATLIRLAQEYQWSMFGDHRTLDQMLDGFSWFFSIGLVGVALGVGAIALPRSTPAPIARRACAIAGAVCLATSAVGYGRWPSPPVIGVGVTAVLFIVAAATFRAPRASA